jgi:hypothetical protein
MSCRGDWLKMEEAGTEEEMRSLDEAKVTPPDWLAKEVDEKMRQSSPFPVVA